MGVSIDWEGPVQLIKRVCVTDRGPNTTDDDAARDALEDARAAIAQVEAWRAELGWTLRETAGHLEMDLRALQRYLADPVTSLARPMPKRLEALMRSYVWLHRAGLLERFLAERG